MKSFNCASAADDAAGFVPRPPLPQHGLAGAAEKERLEQALFALMKQQVPMKLAVGGQNGVEYQPQHGLGLLHLPERIAGAVQRRQFGAQNFAHGAPNRLSRRRLGQHSAEQAIDVLQEPRIGSARRKVQITENFLADNG